MRVRKLYVHTVSMPLNATTCTKYDRNMRNYLIEWEYRYISYMLFLISMFKAIIRIAICKYKLDFQLRLFDLLIPWRRISL